MHADHAGDDELKSCESHAAVREMSEIEGAVRVTDVHHDLRRNGRQRIELDALLLERQNPFVDETRFAFGAADGDLAAILNRFGRIAAADDSRNAELACDDRGMTGTAAPLGYDPSGPVHHRLPTRLR